MRRIRLLLWVLVGVAALAGLALALRSPVPPTPSEAPASAIGGPFTLTAQEGKPFGTDQLKGQPYALFFGFTHCPDVCPTTLARLAKLRRPLGDAAVKIVFVSVDPERDTVAEMAKYASLFDTPVTMLTGAPAEVDRVKTLFGIFSEKVPLKGGDYTVDHSAQVLLFDRDGRFTGTITREESDAVAAAKLKRIAA